MGDQREDQCLCGVLSCKRKRLGPKQTTEVPKKDQERLLRAIEAPCQYGATTLEQCGNQKKKKKKKKRKTLFKYTEPPPAFALPATPCTEKAGFIKVPCEHFTEALGGCGWGAEDEAGAKVE